MFPTNALQQQTQLNSQVSLPKTVFVMVTSPYCNDCWEKKAALTSWFIFDSKFSSFHLFILIASSHSPPPTSNPSQAKPTEPPESLWNPPTSVHLHSHHPNPSHQHWSPGLLQWPPILFIRFQVGLLQIHSPSNSHGNLWRSRLHHPYAFNTHWLPTVLQ